jgi:hypothetical protein
VTDPAEFRPVATYAALVALAHHQAPESFRFRNSPYEFRDDVPAFDLLTGDSEGRERIERGDQALDVAEAVASTDAADHAIIRSAFELGRARTL